MAVAKPAAAKRRAETFMVGTISGKSGGSVVTGGRNTKNGEDFAMRKDSDRRKN